MAYIINESYSIIHQLYNTKQISHKQFTFHNINRKLKGSLYIGGIPENSYLSLPNKVIIKINETLPTWGFILDSIIFNDTLYEMKIPVIINTALHGIMHNKIFEYLVDSCNSNKIIYASECVNTYSFIIQNTKITFNTDFLYHFDHFQNIENFTGMIIGASFLSQFNYTVFDYDNKQIEFYADNSMVNITSLDRMFHTNKIILSIESFIIILNSFLLLYLKHKE